DQRPVCKGRIYTGVRGGHGGGKYTIKRICQLLLRKYVNSQRITLLVCVPCGCKRRLKMTRILGAFLMLVGLAAIIFLAIQFYSLALVNFPEGSNIDLVMAASVVVMAGLPVVGAVLFVGGAIVEAIETEGKATRALLGEKPETGETIL
ncbi:MAG: hypothetical protein Q9M33_13620, partial [Robiginitomaculum sp.]|nr:hypothetical protein [Robiginitomaculum sp.]